MVIPTFPRTVINEQLTWNCDIVKWSGRYVHGSAACIAEYDATSKIGLGSKGLPGLVICVSFLLHICHLFLYSVKTA